MKKLRKSGKLRGFTLVEVMTSLAIMSILIVIASGVIMVTFDIFARNAMMRASQNNGNNIYNYIYDHLSYVTSLKITKNDDIYSSENVEGKTIYYIKESDTDGLYDLNDNDEEFVGKYDDSTDDKYRIIPYFENLTIDSAYMTLMRSTFGSDVYVYGERESNGNIENTNNGCQCIVTFKEFKKNDSDEFPDTIDFSVELQRDGEVFYYREGSIPILNDSAKSHICIPAEINNAGGELNVFYTYLQ